MECNTEAGIIFDVGRDCLYTGFCELPDPRKAGGKGYRLETILTLIVLAKVCGEEKPSGIAERAQKVSRVLSGKRYFGKQVLVAIDGKVLRGTLNEKQEGVYLLAAYLPGEGIVLMEVVIEDKNQELEAASRVLKSLDLRDKVVMGDALHTQRAVSIQIVESGGEYV